MEDGWRLQVAELKLAKPDAEALALIRQAIDEGDMSARVMLATLGDRAGLGTASLDCRVVSLARIGRGEAGESADVAGVIRSVPILLRTRR